MKLRIPVESIYIYTYMHIYYVQTFVNKKKKFEKQNNYLYSNHNHCICTITSFIIFIIHNSIAYLMVSSYHHFITVDTSFDNMTR